MLPEFSFRLPDANVLNSPETELLECAMQVEECAMKQMSTHYETFFYLKVAEAGVGDETGGGWGRGRQRLRTRQAEVEGQVGCHWEACRMPLRGNRYAYKKQQGCLYYRITVPSLVYRAGTAPPPSYHSNSSKYSSNSVGPV